MTTIQIIPVDLIDPHPQNPRHDVGNLAELVKSIKAQGIQQNLLLVAQPPRPIGPARYTAVIGHRRLAAAKKAGLKEVPAAVADLSDAEQLELMLVENVQRTNLSVIEEAEGYQGLLDLGMDTAAIAKTTGRAEKTVRARVKLLALPDVAKAKVHAEQATLEDAAKLAAFEGDPATMEELANALGTHNFSWALSVAQHEQVRLAMQAEIVAAAVECGAVEATTDDELDESIEWLRRPVERVEDLTEVPAGARFERGRYGKGVMLLVPDPNGSIKNAEDAAAKAAREAAAAAARQERDELEVAAKLREAFVREYVTRAKVSAAHTDAILAEAALRILNGDLWSRSDTRAWATTSMRPVCYLLIMLLEGSRHSRWDSPRLQRLYVLLEQLGYPVSVVERARLTPPADDAEEVK